MLKIVQNTKDYYRFYLNENGPAIGQFSLVDQSSHNELKIVAFAIYGEHRGKGYGKQMMQEAIDEANRIRGNKLLTLDVQKCNTRALHIYQKYGFQIAGNCGKEAYVMVYKLSEQPCLKVASIKRVDLRQFYDSEWIVRFHGGSWCKLTRYDTDEEKDIVCEIERCRCIDEVITKCDLRDRIYYD